MTDPRPPSLPLLPPSPDPLDATRIESPCTVPWQGMRGDDRVRYCDHCRQNVYNVSAMAREEALALIGNKEGRVCLRLTRRADGTVVTANCWTRLRQARRRGLLAFGAMMFVVFCAQLVAIAVGLVGLARITRPMMTMGARVAPAAAPPPAQAKPRPAPLPEKHLMGKPAVVPVDRPRPRPATK